MQSTFNHLTMRQKSLKTASIDVSLIDCPFTALTVKDLCFLAAVTMKTFGQKTQLCLTEREDANTVTKLNRKGVRFS